MKKEELLDLGIDEDVAKQVMALHGATVTGLNKQVTIAEQERDNYKQQIADNQEELDTLKESAKGNEDLTSQLSELQTKFEQTKTEADLKLAEQQKEYSIRLALKEASPLDEDIVLGQIDKDTIKVVDGKLQGFDEQLKGLQDSKGFLFQQTELPADKTPQYVAPGNPKSNSSESVDAFTAAVQKYS